MCFNCTDIDRFADYEAELEKIERIEKMKEFVFDIDIKKMTVETLKEWLDISYRWHDEEYIKLFKTELKRRAAV